MMLNVGEVVRPYRPLSVYVAKPATAAAHTKAHMAEAVAAPSPSANEAPRLKRTQAQLSSIGMKRSPTKGQPVPKTQSIDDRVWGNPWGSEENTCEISIKTKNEVSRKRRQHKNKKYHTTARHGRNTIMNVVIEETVT